MDVQNKGKEERQQTKQHQQRQDQNTKLATYTSEDCPGNSHQHSNNLEQVDVPQALQHPKSAPLKDKTKKCGVIYMYKISCSDCDETYIM